VKDAQADFYVLFRIEELVQGDHCTISWKRIPPPKHAPYPVGATLPEGIKSGRLLAKNGDNYSYAAFSFEAGGNGPEIQKVCRNDWDLLFGNSPLPDAFDVTMVTDDRSRIRDLGRYSWHDRYQLGRLSAYEEPEREPSVKAVEGHLYLVHTRDSDSDLYALFRVEKLEPGKSVDITWKLIPSPKKKVSSTTTLPEGTKTGRLLARKVEAGVDNYPFANFSFEFGGNGPEIQKVCRNDWDLIFGNSPLPDAFDVTMVTDDRSRIRDLGEYGWDDKYLVPKLSPYEEPEREPSVKAVEGHIYLVRTRDTNSDLYALFRVEKLEPKKSVEITWKIIPAPKPH
jgi:hypothetical protein